MSEDTAVGTTVRIVLPDPPRDHAAFTMADRYHAQGVLGRGGMGEVRLVEDGLIGRGVAVKTIVPGLAASSDARARFLREVRIQGQLEHPSIVPVYDLGVDESGNEFFTMKRVVGRTLATVLRNPDEMSRNALLAIFRQVCLAVAYAHSRGVVHRDLKPQNVMVGDFGEVYVLDWGVARLDTDPPSGEEMLGTPGYMSPEQLDDANSVDARADVYSLGVILFEILALEPLHPLASAAEAIASTKTQGAVRPSLRNSDREIPPELDDLCARAIAPRRDDRIAFARELADAIEGYLEGDRDLERRREAARQHAAAARAARDRAAAGGRDALDARREALREAGHAVALDPQNRDGLRAALELMLEPPSQLPAEVQDEIDRAQSDRIRAGIPAGLVVFGIFLVTALVVPLVAGPISWVTPVMIAGAITVALVTSARRLRLSSLARHPTGALVAAIAVCTAIALLCGYFGPMLLMPPLAVALTNALVASQTRWRGILVLGILSITVPYVLEWAALVPQSYEFRPDGILVKPVVMQLPEIPVRVAILITSLVALIGSTLYVRRIVLVETQLRCASIIQNWHLRQLARMD